MADDLLKTYHFHLNNGIACFYTPAPSWQMDLWSEFPHQSGDAGRFEAAANHLIEHAIIASENSLFNRGCTRLNLVRFSLKNPNTEIEAKNHLDRLGKMILTPPLNHLSAERERIFEEWAGASACIRNHLPDWGSFTHPATPDCLDPKDPDLTWDFALSFLNRQVDWTRAFTPVELAGQAKFLLSAKHLSLRVHGTLSPPAFYRLLRQSGMAAVPMFSSDAVRISYREVPSNTDYASIHTTMIRIPLHIPPEKQPLYDRAMYDIITLLRRDPEIGLYWVQHQKVNDITTWKLGITKSKENLLKGVIWGNLLVRTYDDNADIRSVNQDILIQAKDHLKADETRYLTDGARFLPRKTEQQTHS